MKMRQTEDRMRALGLMPPTSFLTLDEWEIPRDRVVINRKLGEGAFGTVFGGEAFFDEKGWVSGRARAECLAGYGCRLSVFHLVDAFETGMGNTDK